MCWEFSCIFSLLTYVWRLSILFSLFSIFLWCYFVNLSRELFRTYILCYSFLIVPSFTFSLLNCFSLMSYIFWISLFLWPSSCSFSYSTLFSRYERSWRDFLFDAYLSWQSSWYFSYYFSNSIISVFNFSLYFDTIYSCCLSSYCCSLSLYYHYNSNSWYFSCFSRSW